MEIRVNSVKTKKTSIFNIVCYNFNIDVTETGFRDSVPIRSIIMGKKSSLPLIYLIGVALIAVGFCCPLFSGKLLNVTANGFKFIHLDKNFGWSSLAALLIFCGAVAGIVFCFVSAGKQTSLIRLICVIVSIVGGLIFIIKFSDNGFTKSLGKFNLKYASFGLYMIVAGWIVGLVGAITNK